MAEITEACRLMLSEYFATNGQFPTPPKVERSEPVNEIPDRCPWVGIYRQRVGFPPRTLGTGTGSRMQNATFLLVLTEASTESGQACEDRLEFLVQQVAACLIADQTIRGAVITLQDIDVTYTNFRQTGAAFFQEAIVAVTAACHVTVS